jgi:ACR3 family arsenite efflux pump ArsB
MNDEKVERKLNVFEKYLSLWVVLCIASGIIIGV